MRGPFERGVMPGKRIHVRDAPGSRDQFPGADVVTRIAVVEQPVAQIKDQNEKNGDEYKITDRRQEERREAVWRRRGAVRSHRPICAMGS